MVECHINHPGSITGTIESVTHDGMTEIILSDGDQTCPLKVRQRKAGVDLNSLAPGQKISIEYGSVLFRHSHTSEIKINSITQIPAVVTQTVNSIVTESAISESS